MNDRKFSRRYLVRTLWACLVSLTLLACSRSTAPGHSSQRALARTTFADAAAAPELETDAPQQPTLTIKAPSLRQERAAKRPALSFLQLTTGGARPDAPLPWVVGFHGLGDRPDSFKQLFDNLTFQAHVYLPQAPLAYGSGYDWFGVRVNDGSEELQVALQARLPAVRELLEHLSQQPTNVGGAVVTGFSQGGILSFAVATAGLPQVRAALPIAGTLPHDAEAPSIPVTAFHGEQDRVIPFAHTEALFKRWQTRSGRLPDAPSLQLRAYPNLAHSIDLKLWQQWANELQRALML